MKKYVSVDHKLGVQAGQADPEGLVDRQWVLHLHNVLVLCHLAKQQAPLPLILRSQVFKNEVFRRRNLHLPSEVHPELTFLQNGLCCC